YGAGGGTDQLARLTATELEKQLGQTVIVENLPGAGGIIGTEHVMKSAADGYTLLLGSGSELELIRITDPGAHRPHWEPLTPVALIGTQPMIMVARGTLPIDTADELVQALHNHPGSLSMASAGVGTQLHLAGEMIESSAHIEMPHVPYKSGTQIATDLIGGHIDLAMMAIPTVLPFLQSGKLKALGVTDTQRSPAVPDVPTFNESRSIKNIDMKLWYGLFGPPGLPASVVQRVHQALVAVLAVPATRAKLLGMAITLPKDHSADALNRVKRVQLQKMKAAFEGLKKK
ncbi:MAG: tripartite tricarboxylate transporter substrate binding protein, partial [Caldimonas sp.]